MIVNSERSPGYSEAGYAQLWRHQDLVVLIMGNTVKERQDGTRWLWAANWASGKRINTPVPELEPYEGPSRPCWKWYARSRSGPMRVTGMPCGGLATSTSSGSRATDANGGKALAYYLASIRCEPQWNDQDTVGRVLQDGLELFRAGHPEGVEDKTPTDTCAFLSKFREFRAIDTEGRIYYPDTLNWRECVAIAEALQ